MLRLRNIAFVKSPRTLSREKSCRKEAQQSREEIYCKCFTANEPLSAEKSCPVKTLLTREKNLEQMPKRLSALVNE